MLPSPFYAELPPDLGDDRIWADEAAVDHHRKDLTHRPRKGLRTILDDWLAPGGLALVRRARKALAP